MAGQVVVQFDAKNNVSPVLKKIRADSLQLGKALNGGTSALSKTRKGFSGAGVAAKGASKGVAVFGTAFKSALGPIGTTLAALTGLSAAFKTIAAQDFAVAKVEALGVNSKELVARLKEVSAELNGQASVVELTSSAYDVASAGFANAADAAKVLKAASLGATGGFGDLGSTAKAATAVLNAYGQTADDAGRLVDQFIQTQNDGVIIVAEYAQNIGKVASAAAGLKVPLGEVNAVIAQATASGVQSDVAFTGLKTALAQLASGDATSRMKELGINIDAGTIASEGLLGTFKKIKNSGADTGKVFKLLGAEAGPALLPVLNNLEKFEELLKNQKKSAGVSAKAQARAADTINGAYKRLSTAVSNIFSDQTALGTLIKTVFKAGALAVEGLAAAIQLAAGNFRALATAAAFFGTLAAFAKASAIAQGLLAIKTGILAVKTKIAAVAAAALQAIMNPANIAKIAVALGVAAGASAALGAAMQESAAEAEEGQKKLIDGANGATDALNKQPAAIDAATEAKKRLIESTKESLEFLTKEKTEIEAQKSAYQNTINVTNARLNAEKAINELQGQILERAYEQASSATQRLNIAKQIFHNEVNGAKLAYQQTLNSIKAEQGKLQLKRQGAVIDGQILKARGEMLVAEAKTVEAKKAAQSQAQKALDAQMQAVRLIDGQIKAQSKIGEHQITAAKAQLEAKIMTEEQNLKQKLVSDEIGMSNTNANNLVTSLGNGVRNTGELATGTGQVAENARRSAHMFIQVATQASSAANQINRAATAQRNLNAARSQSSSSSSSTETAAAGAYWSGGFQAFAKGGMVKGPTLGLIGEGGEPEYIIPQSKAAGFAANFLSGKRGPGAIPGFADGGVVAPSSASVNIQTGPVTQMGGQNYVTMQDMSQAVQAGVEQTLQFLMSDGTVRAGVGFD